MTLCKSVRQMRRQSRSVASTNWLHFVSGRVDCALLCSLVLSCALWSARRSCHPFVVFLVAGLVNVISYIPVSWASVLAPSAWRVKAMFLHRSTPNGAHLPERSEISGRCRYISMLRSMLRQTIVTDRHRFPVLIGYS